MIEKPTYEELEKKISVFSNAKDIIKPNQVEHTLQKKVQEMTFLNTLGNQLSSNLSLDFVVQSILDNIFNLIKPDLILIFLRDKNKLFVQGEKYKNSKFRHSDTPEHRVGECMCGLAVSEEKALYSININDDVRCTWNECKKAGFVSFAALPLISGHEIIGVLGIGSIIERDFSNDAVFMETIANQIAMGLKNAISYKQIHEDATKLEQEIIERKQIENELRESEEKYRRITENAKDMIYRMSLPDGHYEYVSPASLDLFGYPPEKFYESPVLIQKIIHPDWINYFKEEWTNLVSGNLPQFYEYQIIHKSGEQKWMNQRNVLICDDNGQAIAIEGTVTDVTQRKKIEEELRESEERFRKIYEHMAVGVAQISLEFQIKRANKAYCSMIGYREEELIGKHLSDITHTEILEENLRKQSQLINGKMDHYRLEKQFIHKKGDVIHGILNASLVRNSQGKPLYFLGSVVDITDRKNMEKSLHESEEKYRSMMESMKDASYICSPELHIEYMNPAMIDRVGTDATGKLCYKTIYDRDEKCSWCVFDQVKKGEHVDYEVADPQDNRYYSVSNSPISHSNGTISKLTIFHDITETKNIEAQLRQSRKMESIGTLAGGIAHDFNNLLYIISGNAELALEDIPKWNPVHTNLEEIKSASLKAAGITKQLLNFSRKTDQEMELVGAVTVIKDALKFLRSTIPATIDIRKHLPDTDITIFADPVQIYQVLMNLCINASQAMEDTGGILEVNVETITLEAGEIKNFVDLDPGKYLKITVTDTGPGIAPEIIERVFDPYFTTKEMGKGSGMGLSIVHGIIQNHNGAISVDSKLDKGTTFSLLFPEVDEKPKIETETIDEIPRGHETILFVDDEKPITDMTQKMLKHLGYKVETSLNPLQALDLFRSKPDTFDLVITDMTMPQMTGAKLSEKLIEIRSNIPVIICTGHSSLIDEEKAKQLGIAGYVMKPVSMATIAKAIQKVLDK